MLQCLTSQLFHLGERRWEVRDNFHGGYRGFFATKRSFWVEMITLPMSTLVEVGDATPLSPLLEISQTRASQRPLVLTQRHSVRWARWRYSDMAVWLVQHLVCQWVSHMHSQQRKLEPKSGLWMRETLLCTHSEWRKLETESGLRKWEISLCGHSERRKLESQLRLWRWRGNLLSFPQLRMKKLW